MCLCPTDKNNFDTKAAVKAANGNPDYYKKLTWQERLLVANYLNSIKYNYPENDPPKLDRTYFRMGPHQDTDDRE
jgi:hypothetical protein